MGRIVKCGNSANELHLHVLNEKTQFLPFFGLRHLVMSPFGTNLRKLSRGAQLQTLLSSYFSFLSIVQLEILLQLTDAYFSAITGTGLQLVKARHRQKMLRQSIWHLNNWTESLTQVIKELRKKEPDQ